MEPYRNPPPVGVWVSVWVPVSVSVCVSVSVSVCNGGYHLLIYISTRAGSYNTRF